MARGGSRSIGSRGRFSHSHSRSHGHSSFGHRRHGTGRAMRNQGQVLQIMLNAIEQINRPPILSNGVLVMQGSQITIINHMNMRIASPDAIMYQPQPMMYPSPSDPYLGQSMYQPPPGYPQQVQMMNLVQPTPVMVQQPYVTEANITVVGKKVASGDTCIYTLIIVLAACLIFPLFFLCCACVKKLTYPKYELSLEFYRLLGAFLRKEVQCRVLKLIVADNTFDSVKVRALYESLQGTQLTGLTFLNLALDFNYLGTQADDFKNNVACMKSLPFTSTFTWGDMIA